MELGIRPLKIKIVLESNPLKATMLVGRLGVFHRPIALASLMSVNVDIRGDGGSPTLTTTRVSVYFTDAGMCEGRAGTV